MVHEPSGTLPPTPWALQTQRVRAPTHMPHIPNDDEVPTCPASGGLVRRVDWVNDCIAMIDTTAIVARPARSGTMRTFRINITP